MIAVNKRWARVLSYLIMVFYAALILFPLYLMFVTSLKDNRQIFTKPFSLPGPIVFSGYVKLFTVSQYQIYFRNSIVVTLISLGFIVLLTSLASYALAKYQFRARILVYVYFVAGLIIPIRLGTIGILKTMINIKLFDTPWSLIIVFIAMGIPLGIFILYDFIRMIPEELSNSARIDGCSEHAIFRRIIMPLTKPALATVAIINFIPVWNDFWFPLILIRSNDVKTVPLATALLFGQFETNFGMVFAVLSMASIPVMVFYLFLSRYFIKGLTKGAMKG
ncbi:MAG: carbohydrate ABC transporter permease [Spirochaetaceae bacterium]|nr:carbohydrate ABC transporter permease [Spirochaetaceae bacterium]